MDGTSKRVAIIGGGISGTCAANHLMSLLDNASDLEVVLFDQGGRGTGGRASHRRVRKEDGRVLADNIPLTPAEALENYQFDHGCQFFCASDDAFQKKVNEWCISGVAKLWEKRCGLISAGAARTSEMSTENIRNRDFFGILSGSDCYVGVGGIHKIARFEASSAVKKGAVLRSGVRVSRITPISNQLLMLKKGGEEEGDGNDREASSGDRGDSKVPSVSRGAEEELKVAGNGEGSLENGLKWELYGVGGTAALHDTAEKTAAAAVHTSLGRFHSVIVTDASCSFEGWHRASAGISSVKPEFSAFIKSRARVPLFTVMVAFDCSVTDSLDAVVFDLSYDGISPNSDEYKSEIKLKTKCCSDGLWFAARNTSKPGLLGSERTDVWTLVSTPSFAVSEISTVTMQSEIVLKADQDSKLDEGVGVGDIGVKMSVFKPQENSYLNEGPALTLALSFLSLMKRKRMRDERSHANNVDVGGRKKIFHTTLSDAAEEGERSGTGVEKGVGSEAEKLVEPRIIYLQGQRWGSAFPGDFLPEKLDSSASFFSFDHKYREVEGVVYQRQIPDLRVESDHRSSKTNSENLDAEDGEKKDKSCEKKEDCSEKDYLFDDELGLYYCGDFCSKRAAGIQAAALSGIDVANHVLKTLF